MREHQIGRFTYNIENPLLEDVKARMQIEPVSLDTQLARDIDGCTSTNHRIGENARMQPFENVPVHIAGAVAGITRIAPRSALRKRKDAAAQCHAALLYDAPAHHQQKMCIRLRGAYILPFRARLVPR